MSSHYRRAPLIMMLVLGWGLFATVAWAQPDPFQAQQARRTKLKAQVKCLERCDKKAQSRFYRCGSRNRTLCNIRAKVYTEGCIAKCRAPWFCRNFSRIAARCPKMCLNKAAKRIPRRRYNRKRKKWYRTSKKALARWKKRTIYACHRTCYTINNHCNLKSLLRLNNKPKPRKRKNDFDSVPF